MGNGISQLAQMFLIEEKSNINEQSNPGKLSICENKKSRKGLPY